MRTRNRDNLVIDDSYQVKNAWENTTSSQTHNVWGTLMPPNSAGESTSTYYDAGSASGRKESMTDIASAGPLSYNEVSHVVEQYDCPSQEFSCEGTDKFGTVGTHTVTTGSCGAYAPTSFGLKTSAVFDIVGMKSEAQSRVDPSRIQASDFNLPTFLGELSDTITLAKSAKSGFASLLKKRSPFRNVSTFGDLVRQAASADLTYQLSIKPLLADIGNFINSVMNLDQAMNAIAKAKRVRIYGTSNRADTSSSESANNYGSRHSWRVEREHTAKVVTWFLVDIEVPPWGLTEKLRYLGDYWNVASWRTTAWELTPFSWIADYFVSFGDYVSQFDGHLLEIPYSIVASGWSSKVETKAQGTLYPFAVPPYDTLTTVSEPSPVMGYGSYTSYQRTPGDVSVGGFRPIRFSLPDFRQALNVAELLLLLNR